MKNNQFRRFVVFLSCLSLILSFALPVSAYETTDTGTFLATALPSDIVVSSIMNGIGVLPGQNTSEYKSAVDRCVEYLIEQGKVIDGNIEVWQREQVVDYSLWKYGIDVSMVDVVRSWLFDSQTVKTEFGTTQLTCTYSGNMWNGTVSATATVPAELVCFWRSGNYNYDAYGIFAYAPQSSGTLYVTIDGERIGATVYSGYQFVQLAGASGSICDTMPTATCQVYNDSRGQKQWKYVINKFISDGLASAGQVVANGDFNLGSILPAGVSLVDAYPDWYKNSVAIPVPGSVPGTDEDVIAVPFAPGSTLDDTLSIPQTDVWNGSGTLTDTPSVPGTATLSDILAAVLSIPKAIVSSITEALSKFFGISGNADSFGISLTDFFPFCIPFDIFDFLSVLSADPVAPVFHWELPVPQLGRIFEIDVDLSAWDPVAAVFRTFELLAFVVGLGMVTREKFLRS